MQNNALTGERLFTSRDLTRLIIPLIIEQFLAVTVGMADTFMIASVGEAAVSGVSLVDVINNLIIQILAALSTGGAVIVSQFLGRRESRNACMAAKQLLYSTTVLALLLAVAALAARRPILRLLFGEIDADVMENAVTYLTFTAISFPFLAIYNSCAALFRSMGNSKVSMLSSLLMNVVNIGGNALFIYGFRWGVAGAGAATLASRALAAIIILRLVGDHRNAVFVEHLQRIRFEWPMIKNILRVGIPNGIENGLFNIGKLIVQGFITGLGTAAIAANAIAGSISGVLLVPGNAVALALITVVGQCVGAGAYDQARFYIKRLMLLVYVCVAFMSAALMLLLEPLTGLFPLSDAARGLVLELLPTFALVMAAIWPMAFPFPNVLRAAGDVRYTMVVSMISMWSLRVGMCYVFVDLMHLGVSGVWYAMYCDWLGRSACFFLRYLSGKWKNKRVIA